MENETKEERFQRLATARVRAVIERLRILSNCSNLYMYAYSEKDVNKIFGSIEEAVKESRFLFKKNLKKEFTLGGD